MKLSAVYFSQLVAINESDRVSSLTTLADDGTGDPAMGWDSLEMTNDHVILARRGDRDVFIAGWSFVAVPAPAVEGPSSAMTGAPAGQSTSPADSGAATAEWNRRLGLAPVELRPSRKRRKDP